MNSVAGAADRLVALWLFCVCALVALMVIVGGATRLTDSGLSIVEWRPVTGAIPPLTEPDWLAEFEKYKAIPEYREVNWGMSLGAFKEIYWWEWGHRFLGRLIGAAFLIPLIFFIATRRVDRPLALKLGAIFLLGGAQGALGWWMVSSGLSDRVDVSQYRLAAHLGLAVALFGAIFWVALDLVGEGWWGKMGHSCPPLRPSGAHVVEGFLDSRLRGNERIEDCAATITAHPRESGGPVVISTRSDAASSPGRLAPLATAMVLLVFVQIILGAFVAGLRAGRTFNTWPLMDGAFFPGGYFAGAPDLADMLETAAAVQFNHRLGAYVLAAAAIALSVVAGKTELKGRARILLAAVGLQVVLGVWTVLAATPIALGLAHQAGALLVFAAALYFAHGCIMRPCGIIIPHPRNADSAGLS